MLRHQLRLFPLVSRSLSISSRSAITRPVISTFRASRWMTSRPEDASEDRHSDLATMLGEEIAYEKESMPTTDLSDSMKAFLKESPFKMMESDTGKNEIKLVRSFGNEKITATVNIVPEIREDSSELADENVENKADDMVATLYCTIDVQKSKDGKDAGTMTFQTMIENSSMVITNAMYCNDSALMTEDTAESENRRNGLYLGPTFEDLDEDLQEEFYSYLEERGFDVAFFDFVDEYASFREQQEYVNWLEKVKNFVSNN